MRVARAIVVATVAVLVLLGTWTVRAQQAVGEDEPRREFSERREEIAPRFPRASNPSLPMSPTGVGTGFQLVGFTQEAFDGNKGILNLTRACQRRFKLSRVCTADEVSESISVPVPVEFGYAWIRNGGRAGSGSYQDCRGQTSDSSDVLGMTIEMGPDSGCYGGFVLRGCDEEHPVACCAQAPSTR